MKYKRITMPAVKKAVVAEPVVVAKPAPKKKDVKAAAVPVATAVPVAAPVAAIAVADEAEVVERSSGEIAITELVDKVAGLSSYIKTIQVALKMLVKEFDKQKKIVDKVQKKKEKAKKSPSGFAKPCKISDELCDFIGIAKGTELSRTDITRHINSYVKEHNLNNPENRREFFPDAKLKSILNIKDGEKVTYFVLQRLIAHHFPPSLSKLAAAKAAAV
jgi:chromatin remodeling complex protein RSC6